MAVARFNDEDRQPIIPLSMENIDLAKIKEFIINYKTNQAYIKKADGSLIDIYSSINVFEFIKQYLLNHPDVILDITIIDINGNTKTIRQTFDDICNQIIALQEKKYLYAGSKSDGGSANRAEKVNHNINFKKSNCNTVFNGLKDEILNIAELGLFRKSGGYINGPMIPKQKFILTEKISYGKKLPDTGEEGQFFILLIEDV